MISREWAVEVVERHLQVVWERRPTAAQANLDTQMVITGVQPHELGWLVHCQSRRYVETQNFKDMLIGHGPFLVDGLDGSLHMVHFACIDGVEWSDQYREKVRGQIPPRALDVELARLNRSGLRYEALKAARRAGGEFSPSEAQRYVDAIAEGGEPPAELVARLPRRNHGYGAISTLSGPNPEP